MPAIGRAQEMEKAGNSKIAYYCYLYAVIKVGVLQASSRVGCLDPPQF